MKMRFLMSTVLLRGISEHPTAYPINPPEARMLVEPVSNRETRSRLPLSSPHQPIR
jgi:hypothetical protein